MATPVRLRTRAAQDIDEAIAYCQREAGDAVAGRFIDALERTLNRISRTPHTGALRFAYDLDIPGLRHLGLARFPFAVFSVETVALGSFVVSTTSAVWAHASSVDALDDAQLMRVAVTDPRAEPSSEALRLAREHYRTLVRHAYANARMFWQIGVGALLAAIGVLSHAKVPIALPLGGIGGALVTVLTTDKQAGCYRKAVLWALALVTFLLGVSTVGA